MIRMTSSLHGPSLDERLILPGGPEKSDPSRIWLSTADAQVRRHANLLLAEKMAEFAERFVVMHHDHDIGAVTLQP